MKKFFIELCWNQFIPYIHLKDLKTKNDEFFDIPCKFDVEKINQKICSGALNPYTREYIGCDNLIEENEIQCNKCKKYIDKKYNPDGYNVGLNCGKDAGQSVMHVHMHLIPRYKGDVENPHGGVRGVIPNKKNY